MDSDDHIDRHMSHRHNNDTRFFFSFYTQHKMVVKCSLMIEGVSFLDAFLTTASKSQS